MMNERVTVRDKIKQLEDKIAMLDKAQWSQPSNNRALIICSLEKELKELKHEKTLGQVMEEMAVDWKEFADCMPTSYEVYDDGRDEDAN